ncbi:MAG: peptidylprolyl isomerase [Bacteroidales bacterium]|nr:peptidylprolyl isomerase [Bacteroidales bacterium]
MDKTENKYISVAYKLYVADEEGPDLVEETTEGRPFEFVSGLGITFEEFENQVKDLKQGDSFDFTVGPEEAYGDYEEDYVIELPKQVFEVDGKFDDEQVVPGNVIPLLDSDGNQLNGMVVEVKEDIVIMDMNHPLAGEELHFVGTILESRPATIEEMEEMANLLGGDCECDSSDCGSCNCSGC